MAVWLIVVCAALMAVGGAYFVYSIVCDKVWAFGVALALFLIAQAIAHLSW